MPTVSLVLGFHFNMWYKPLRWQSFSPCLFLHLLSNNPITMVKFLCWIKWRKDEWIKMYVTDTFHVSQFGPAARHRASQQTNVSSRSLSSKTWGSYTRVLTSPLAINKTLKWLTLLPTLMPESFWWCQHSIRHSSSLPSPPPGISVHASTSLKTTGPQKCTNNKHAPGPLPQGILYSTYTSPETSVRLM